MRTELERRPALLAFAGLAVGLTASAFLPNLLFLVAGLVLLRSLPARVALCGAFLVGAVLAPELPTPISAPIPLRQPLTGTVCTVPTPLRTGGASFLLQDQTGARWEVKGEGWHVRLGDDLRVSGTEDVVPPDYRASYVGRGVRGIIAASGNQVTIDASAHGLAELGDRWRSSFLTFANDKLSTADSATLGALAFDVRTGLSQETRDDLEHSGTEHVLAASGIHLLILAWFLELVLSRLATPFLFRRAFIFLLLSAYAFAAGLHPGTFRAVVSNLMRDGAVVLAREYDGLTSLCLAGIAFALWQPYAIYDAGFQMTMVLGAGLAIARSNTVGLPWYGRLWRISLTAWLVSVPLTAHLFGVVSVVSIPANFLAMAILPASLLGILLAHLFSTVSPTFCKLLLLPTTASVHLLQQVVHFFGALPVWGIQVPPFNGYWLVPLYSAGLFLWKPRSRPAK